METALRHLAVIMDGNGRWATTRGLPRYLGHRAGVRAIETAIKAATEHGVRYLSLFAFGQDNFKRSAEEVGGIFRLVEHYVRARTAQLVSRSIRVRTIGDLTQLPKSVALALRAAERATMHGTALDLIVAINYSGQWELERACNRLLSRHDEAAYASVTSDDIEQCLALPDVPAPDLLIRTGGERRLSNFYLWQMAYTELYFADVLWPDVSASDFDTAIAWFYRRERRFGAAPAASMPAVAASGVPS